MLALPPAGFDFPPLQGQARFDLLFDEVLVARVLLKCNGVGPNFVLLFFLLMTGDFRQ